MDLVKELKRRLGSPVKFGRGLANRPTTVPRADLASAVVVSALMVP